MCCIYVCNNPQLVSALLFFWKGAHTQEPTEILPPILASFMKDRFQLDVGWFYVFVYLLRDIHEGNETSKSQGSTI